MTPEEYERFKEAEKNHLRKLKEIKKVHAQMQRKSQVTRAVTDMASGIEDLFSEHEEMVYRLQADARRLRGPPRCRARQSRCE